jgi:hypothetical protein
MNLLSDIIVYVRRIIKAPLNTDISDSLIVDYINRFWIMDVSARMQLFDLKKKYQFQTQPGVDKYNMPLYSIQNNDLQTDFPISMMPVYQGFLGPCYINGIEFPFYTLERDFYNIFPKVVQNLTSVELGDGGPNYSFTLPILSNSTPLNPPINGLLRGHVDIAGIIATNVNQDPPLLPTPNLDIPTTSIEAAFYITTLDSAGQNVVISDSGQFLNTNPNYGLLIYPGKAPYGNIALPGGYSTTSNTVNYLTGEVNVTFPVNIPEGTNINVQCYYFQSGLPRGLLYYNNTITLRMPPSQAYLVELEAYLTPSAFLSSNEAIPYAYMGEYIARGAARKIMSDTGDIEQFQFYEGLFKEQELLVWKRSQRQFTSTRTPSLYSQGFSTGIGNNNFGGGTL